MKIKNIIKYKNKLLKLKLVKTKTYKKKDSLINTRIEDIEYRLKKALHIIYKYNVNNKRILFVGVPVNTNKEIKYLVSNTKHTFIPESTWINGILTNKMSCFKYLSKNPKAANNKTSKLLLKLGNKSDLIVVLDETQDTLALNEGYTTRIPVISLNWALADLKTKSSYKVPGNFKFTKKKVRDNFFFSLLKATFKKASQLKSKKFS